MNNSNRREKYSVSVGNNQLVLILNSEILLPEDAPVRVTSAQLEELDYRKLYKAYSSRGRNSPFFLMFVWMVISAVLAALR